MTMRNLVFLLTCSALWGCVASVHPLYTERDVVFDPDLCGTWFDLDSGEGIPAGAFAQDPDDPKAYRLTDTKGDNKAPQVMTVHLVERFLNNISTLYVTETESSPYFQRNTTGA